MTAALEVPRLHRPPVTLRAFTPADADLVQEASTDPLIPSITTVPTPADPLAVQAFIERQHARAATGQGYSFAIADAASDRGAGQIGLWPLGGGRASVGYWVVSSARRRGVAAHALAAVSDWGLGTVGLARLELYVEPWNEGSWRTAERVGYQREGLLRSWQEVGGTRRDMFMYSLLGPGRSRTPAPASRGGIAERERESATAARWHPRPRTLSPAGPSAPDAVVA